MKKENIILFLCIIGFIGMSGCSTDNNLDPVDPANSGKRILASTQYVSLFSVETKASYNETTPSVENPLKARILASKTSGSYTKTSDLHADGTMTFTGTGKTPYDTEGFWGKNYYELTGSLYFCGLYPATGWTESPTTTASFTFTGKEDVMFAPQTSSDITEEAEKPVFSFNHLLTKLNIKLVGNEGIPDAWGDITELALINTQNTVTVSLDGTDIRTISNYSGDDNTILSAHLVSGDTPVSSETPVSISTDPEAEPQAYILAAPVIATNSDPEYSLYIKTSNGSVRTIKLNLKKANGDPFIDSTQGCSFNVILNFQGDQILVETNDLTITEWSPSLVLQSIMFTSQKDYDEENIRFGLTVLSTINRNSNTHKYPYFGLYGVNDINHSIEIDLTGLAQFFDTGQHLMFDMKKLIRTWGINPDTQTKWTVSLKNYEPDWELSGAKQHPNPNLYPEVDVTTSATLPADFPKIGNPEETVRVELSDVLYDMGSLILIRK